MLETGNGTPCNSIEHLSAIPKGMKIAFTLGMGASGGLTFCKVNDKEAALTFLRSVGIYQLSPWSFDVGCSMEDGHNRYLEEHPPGPQEEWLEYGTSTERPDWDAIAEWASPENVDFWETRLWVGCTLFDVITDMETDPSKRMLGDRSDQHLGFGWQLQGEWSYSQRHCALITVRDWCRGINLSCALGTRRREKTWT